MSDCASAHGGITSPVRTLRHLLRNLSPTRRPSVESDASLWQGWTDTRIEDLDLDQFDDNGFPIAGGGI